MADKNYWDSIPEDIAQNVFERLFNNKLPPKFVENNTFKFLLKHHQLGKPTAEVKKAWANTRLVCKSWREFADDIFPFERSDALSEAITRHSCESLSLILRKGYHNKPGRVLNIIQMSYLNPDFTEHRKMIEILLRHPGTLPDDFPFKKIIEWSLKEDRMEWASFVINWNLKQDFAGKGLQEAVYLRNELELSLKESELQNQASFLSRALMSETKVGNHERVKELLKDPSVDPNYALGSAAFFNQIDIAKLLLEDVRSKVSSFSILVCAEKGHSEMLEVLTQKRRIGEDETVNSLALASINGHTHTIKVILRKSREASLNEKIRNITILSATIERDEELLALLRKHPSFTQSTEEDYQIAKSYLTPSTAKGSVKQQQRHAY